MNIVLFGPPGAGKGTQARILQDSHQFTIISTGDILREEIKRESRVGLQVKKTIEEGLYPSDNIVLSVFEDRLKQEKGKNLVLDGIPRTLNQAQMVDKIFESLGLCLDTVIQISVDDKELVQRLSNRFICKVCSAPYTAELPPRVEGICDKCQGSEFVRRADDEPEAIKTRLDVYNEQTKPLLQYYSQMNRLRIVDGMKPVEEVNAQIESLLGEMQLLTSKSGCLYSA
jgi:adenylate kinase